MGDKVKVFLSSRFGEFEELRQMIITKNFDREDIDVVALEAREYTTQQTPKEASIEYAQESDIYILFVGKTYGGIPEGESVSYTHLEYRAVIEKNMVKIIFLFGDEYLKYGDSSKIENQDVKQWVDEIYADMNAPIIKTFETAYKFEDAYEIIKKSLNATTTNLTKKALNLSTVIKYDETLLQSKIIKFFDENKNDNLLKELVVRYMPEYYIHAIPLSMEGKLQLLFEYGAINGKIPIVCVFKGLVQVYTDAEILKEALDYFINVKFKDVFFECKENKIVKERSFLIEFLGNEEDSYSVQFWEHFENNFLQKELAIPETIHLNKSGIQLVFNELNKFFNNERYRGVTIYLEIILPIEKLVEGIKEWTYTGKYKDKRVISRYKYVLRIQERFRHFDIGWETKWGNIEQEKTILENKPIFLKSHYNEDISASNICVLSEDKVEGLEEVFCDIDENYISIALLHLSNNVDMSEYKVLCSKCVRDAKSNISEFVCSNHNNENSEMIFLFDDPYKVPKQFKEQSSFQYGFD